MQTLYNSRQIRAIERRHAHLDLMERAGLATAELARDLVADGLSILVVAGPGNNGGDALVAARHLRQRWHRVDVVFAGDAAKLSGTARNALEAWHACGGGLLEQIPAGTAYGLVIDGLFGLGLGKPLQDEYAGLVDRINGLDTTVLSIDLPSGICADTGRVLGCAVVADHTLTFIGLKPGLFTLDGPDHAGRIHLCDLGLDTATADEITGTLLDHPPALPAPRKRNSHKGSYGSIGVLGGDHAMCGAALMAGRAALHAGAGRVFVGLLAENAPPVDSGQPELMLRPPRALLDIDHLSALAVGPGMGRSNHALGILRRALHYPAPLLLDADALHLVATEPELVQLCKSRPHANVMTPHPAEAAALLGCSLDAIQADRIAAACRIAQTYEAVTVLKGCGSVIATPDGRWSINGSGNPGLASAGTGDVLSGIIAGLLAQGLAAASAALTGVYLHGAAADSLVAAGVGPIGLTATELMPETRDLLNRWMTG